MYETQVSVKQKLVMAADSVMFAFFASFAQEKVFNNTTVFALKQSKTS